MVPSPGRTAEKRCQLPGCTTDKLFTPRLTNLAHTQISARSPASGGVDPRLPLVPLTREDALAGKTEAPVPERPPAKVGHQLQLPAEHRPLDQPIVRQPGKFRQRQQARLTMERRE